MFRGSESSSPILPLGGTGPASSNKPRAQIKLPEFGLAQILSFIWLGVSLLLLLVGALHGRGYAEGTVLKCNADQCVYQYFQGRSPMMETVIPRANIQRAELVRISMGQIVNTASMSRKAQRKLGQSYALTYYEYGDEEDTNSARQTKQALLGVTGTSRKKAKNRVSKINRYTRKEVDKLDVEDNQVITVGGAITMAIGVISLVFSLLIGEFSPPKDKRKKAN